MFAYIVLIVYLCRHKRKLIVHNMAKKINQENALSAYPTNKTNPFLEQAIEVVNKNVVKKYKNATHTGERAVLQAIDPDTGEMRGITSFVRQIEVDEDKFVKLYMSNFQQFFDLSQSAIRVFGYLMQNLYISKDMIVFDLEACKEYTQYKSKTTIYKGLAELVSANIIARGWSDTIYFINPMCVFNGSRINFVHSYVIKTQDNAETKGSDNTLIDKI